MSLPELIATTTRRRTRAPTTPRCHFARSCICNHTYVTNYNICLSMSCPQIFSYKSSKFLISEFIVSRSSKYYLTIYRLFDLNIFIVIHMNSMKSFFLLILFRFIFLPHDNLQSFLLFLPIFTLYAKDHSEH